LAAGDRRHVLGVVIGRGNRHDFGGDLVTFLVVLVRELGDDLVAELVSRRAVELNLGLTGRRRRGLLCRSGGRGRSGSGGLRGRTTRPIPAKGARRRLVNTQPVHTEPDEVLAIRARDDREAFGVLYERHVRKIYNYVYYRTGVVADAEDLTARTFFQAMSNLH